MFTILSIGNHKTKTMYKYVNLSLPLLGRVKHFLFLHQNSLHPNLHESHHMACNGTFLVAYLPKYKIVDRIDKKYF